MKRKHEPKPDWICQRTFVLGKMKSARKAVGRIARPIKSGSVWVCSFKVSNIGMSKPIEAVGEDSMQALVLAFEGMLTTVRRANLDWRWVYGEAGELGIPRGIPSGFGRAFAKQLEDMVDLEVERFARNAEHRNREPLTLPKAERKRGARLLRK